jgi:hypothetical protein
MAMLFTAPLPQVNSSGVPYSGAKLYFYQTGTTTGITTYQDSAAGTPHAQPVVADSAGEFAAIYVNTATFKVVLKDSADVTIKTIDPVNLTADEMIDISGDIKDDELFIVDQADGTKKTRIDSGAVTAGQTRVLTMADRDMDLRNLHKGSDVASAGTMALGLGNFFHITGTTTITDIDFTDAYNGRWAILEFDGALTLTHHATTLVLPGAANITTAAGDTCMVMQDSGDNIHVVWYQRKATEPPRSQAWELIESGSVSSAATKDFTNLSAYFALKLIGRAFPATDATTLQLRTSTDNGSTFDAGASDYDYQSINGQSTTLTGAVASATSYIVNVTNTVGNAGSESIAFEITMIDFNTASNCLITSHAAFMNPSGAFSENLNGGQRANTTARNAFRLLFSSGNISSMRYRLIGLR